MICLLTIQSLSTFLPATIHYVVEMLLHLKMSNITNCYGNLHSSWSRKKVKEIVWESIGHNCTRHYYCMLIVVVIMRGSGQRDAAADKQLTTVGDCIKTCPWSSNWSLVTPHLVLSRSSNEPSPSLKLYNHLFTEKAPTREAFCDFYYIHF